MSDSGGERAGQVDDVSALVLYELPQPVVLLSPLRDESGEIVDFCYEYLNRASEVFMSVSTDEIHGRHLCEILGVVRGRIMVAALRTAFDHDEVTVTDLPFSRGVLKIVAKRHGDRVIAVLSDVSEERRVSRAEQVLRESLAASDDMVAILEPIRDADGVIVDLRYVFANAKLADFVGFAVDELVGRPMFSITPPLAPGRFERLVGVIETGVPFTAEVATRNRDREVVLRIVASAGRGGVVTISRDVTVERRAEVALQRSEERFRSTVEGLHEVVLTFSSVRDDRGEVTDFRFESANPAAERLFRLPVDEVVGRGLVEVYPHFVEAGVFARCCVVVESGVADLIEIPRGDRPGVAAGAFIEASVSRLGDGLVVIVRDISERTRLTSELRESERRYRVLADNAGDVVFEVTDNIVTWVGPSVELLFGFRPDEFVGRDSTELVHPDDRAVIFSARPSYELGSSRRFRVRTCRKDGSYVWVDTLIRPVADADGVFRGSVVATVWSVQAEVEAQQALARVEQERREDEARFQHALRLESLGMMAGGVAHDFNNLLVGVLGNADLAMGSLDADAPAMERLERIVSAAQHAAALTGQLLDYAGRRPERKDPVDLGVLLAETVRLVQSRIAESCAVSVDAGDDPVVVLGDASQLQQVLTNLVINASDACAGGCSPVRVWTEMRDLDEGAARVVSTGVVLSPGRYVVVHVDDDGPGIASETLEHIFEPFFTTRLSGRGLGLAVVHGVVRDHGGAVHVTSRVGIGTEFSVFLPVADQTVAVRSEPVLATRRWDVAPLVLVVDDDDDVREVCVSVLERGGLRVRSADSGAAAIEVFGACPDEFAVVVLDLTMPVMSGDAVLIALREIDPEIPVVLVSGYSNADVQTRIGDLAVNGFVQKPFTSTTLDTTVNTALRTHDRDRESDLGTVGGP
jgi:PAS domain S-box-containing protein